MVRLFPEATDGAKEEKTEIGSLMACLAHHFDQLMTMPCTLIRLELHAEYASTSISGDSGRVHVLVRLAKCTLAGKYE